MNLLKSVKRVVAYGFVVCLVIILSACATSPSLEYRIDLANEIASKHNFSLVDIQTDSFKIRTFQYIQVDAAVVRVFFEGDGLAWLSRSIASDNPTPINPVGLRLAVMDSHSDKNYPFNSVGNSVVYIARPCQYVADSLCERAFWTGKRYSKKVILSLNEVVNKIKYVSGAEFVELVGFSGGGAIAVLVASIRDDVTKITTFNGNLNHKLLNEYHQVSPLYGSLNPIDVAKKIAHIPQIHYISEFDKVIVPHIAMSFKKKLGKNSPVKVIVLPNQSHELNVDLLKEFLAPKSCKHLQHLDIMQQQQLVQSYD